MNVIPDGDWDSWAEKHRFRFGLLTEDEQDMVESWRELFESCGYTAVDLHEASDWMGQNDPPTFRQQHLNRIQARIQTLRLKRYQAEREESQARIDAEACRFCDSTGYLVVPHLGFVVDGQWVAPFYTFAVCCNCRKGAATYERQRTAAFEDEKKRAKAMMSIGDYEQNNPNWRRQMAARKQAQDALARANGYSERVDKNLGKILNSIGRRS